jgi:hypothetical protein
MTSREETTRRRRELAHLLIEREQLLRELGLFGFGQEKAALQLRGISVKRSLILAESVAFNQLCFNCAQDPFYILCDLALRMRIP